MKNNRSVITLTQTALLMALIVLASFLPIKIVVEITVCFLPVAIGAILLGPATGAFLGGFWGLCSFAQCFGLFAPSPFGAALAAINPWLTAVMCLVPRILAGAAGGCVARGMKRAPRPLAYAVSSLAVSVANTVLFTAACLALFGHSDYLLGLRAGKSLLAFAVAFVGINGILEAAISVVVGTAVAGGITAVTKRK